MKHWIICIIFSALLVIAPAYANLDAPEITMDTALRQGTSVVFGQFTGHSSTDLWEYDGMFDATGKPTHYTEVVTVYEFRVDELIDGKPVAAQIQINVPGGVKNQFKTPSKVQVPSAGHPVALSITEDRSARVRGRGGYNMVHAKYVPIDSPTQLAQMREHARALRVPLPTPIDAVIERNLEGLDFGTGVVSDVPNHEPDRPDEENDNDIVTRPSDIRQGEKIPQQRMQEIPLSSSVSSDAALAHAETSLDSIVNLQPSNPWAATSLETLGTTALVTGEAALPPVSIAIEWHRSWIIIAVAVLLGIGGLALARKMRVRLGPTGKGN